MVITTKSVEYMPFLLSLFCFANGVCWFSYALIRFDPFVAVITLSFSIYFLFNMDSLYILY